MMMTSGDEPVFEITPQVLLKAYSCGIFPMAEGADDPALYWIEPEHRGILPLETAHFPRRLLRTIRTTPLTVRVDHDFEATIDGCAGIGVDRPTTWINKRIRELYQKLFEQGHCHTIEVYDGDDLVGGLYGVALQGAFFGESMFSRERDASKIALAHLVARLRYGHFKLLDTQFVTEHLQQFGVIEINRTEFQTILETALSAKADFLAFPKETSGTDVARMLSQNEL